MILLRKDSYSHFADYLPLGYSLLCLASAFSKSPQTAAVTAVAIAILFVTDAAFSDSTQYLSKRSLSMHFFQHLAVSGYLAILSSVFLLSIAGLPLTASGISILAGILVLPALIDNIIKIVPLYEGIVLYKKGMKEVRKNPQLANEYFEDAAKMGNRNALVAIGFSYLIGRGIQENPKKAFEYLLEAARLGDSEAMNQIGCCYVKGHGTDKNLIKAKKWFEKAVANNSSYACYNLGCLYEKGEGAAKDPIKALAYYQVGANRHSTLCVFKVTVAFTHI